VTGEAIRTALKCKALRLLVRFAPKRPSSGRLFSAPRKGLLKPVTIGEYDRAGLDGEKDDTWRSMTESSVAFMRAIMLARRTGGSG
jgi:hypothetical protein